LSSRSAGTWRAVDVGERVLGFDLGVGGSLGADPVGELFRGILIGSADDQVVPAAHRLEALVLQLLGELAGLFVGGELGADLVGGEAAALGGLLILGLHQPLVLGLFLGRSGRLGRVGRLPFVGFFVPVTEVEVGLPALPVEELLDRGPSLIELVAVARVEVDRLAFVAEDHAFAKVGRELVLELRRAEVVGNLADFALVLEVDLQAPVVVHALKPRRPPG
jgi:hypothetical protein